MLQSVTTVQQATVSKKRLQARIGLEGQVNIITVCEIGDPCGTECDERPKFLAAALGDVIATGDVDPADDPARQ